MELLPHRPDYSGLFLIRGWKKGASIATNLILSRNSSIRSSLTNRALQKGCYLFLNNPKITEQLLTAEMTNRCKELAKDRHLLVIQDTSSFNLNRHYYRLKPDSGLGPIEDNFHLGFFLHASMVVDAFSDTLLGISNLQLRHRAYNDPHRASKAKRLPIEQKESYKWIKACEQSKQVLTDAFSITFVKDRDGNIYEQFAFVPNEKVHFFIRCCKERRLADCSRLFETLRQQKISGSYKIAIKADRRIHTGKQNSTFDLVKFVCVSLRNTKTNCYPKIMCHGCEYSHSNHAVNDGNRRRRSGS